MANPQPQDVLGRITLVTGPEEFLGERAIAAVRAAVRAPRRGGGVLRDDGRLADDGRARRPRLAVAVLHDPLRRRPRARGPARGVGSRAARLRRRRRPRTSPWCWRTAAAPRAAACSPSCASSPRVTEVKSAPLTAREFPGFVVNELRARKVRIDPDAADFLVQAVGQDLRSLSAAASQLANDFEGQPLSDRDGEELLRRPGRGQVVRRRRPRPLRPDRQGARGAALGAGPRHRAGAGHQRHGRRSAQPGQVHVGRRGGCATPT